MHKRAFTAPFVNLDQKYRNKSQNTKNHQNYVNINSKQFGRLGVLI